MALPSQSIGDHSHGKIGRNVYLVNCIVRETESRRAVSTRNMKQVINVYNLTNQLVIVSRLNNHF